MNQPVRIRELAQWGFDDYPYRPPSLHPAKPVHAVGDLETDMPFDQGDVVLTQQSADLQEMFAPHAKRADLLEEMTGLSWSLGVVDLRSLLAFQRRLSFDQEVPQHRIPAAQDWSALLALSFGPAKEVNCKVDHHQSTQTMMVRSTNPNLHFRMGGNVLLPVRIHAGGPFLEVARYRNRWFLRDGYHRAFAFMQAGVFEVPAVIIELETLADLGATQPWFFPEQVLFSNNPPRVVDFLNNDLVLEYYRPRLIKTLHLTMTETLTPAPVPGEPS